MDVGTSRGRRIALAALVLPALVLAAVAARSYRPFGGGSAGDRAASSTFVDTVFTLAAVALVTSVVWLVWARWRPLKGGAVKDPGRLSPFAFLLYLAVITGAFMLLRHGLEQPRPTPEGGEGLDPAFPDISVPESPRLDEGAARGPDFVWPLAVGVAAAIVFVAIAAVIARRRRRQETWRGERLDELGAALDEALEDLRREPDPRRAVVAAYARMEQALTVHGYPRRASEAPYEYLSRVGRELEAERSASSLTELFEVAKFSSHTVDEDMRSRAIDALVAVRDEVRRAA